MYGSQEAFEYLRCQHCGCLQLVELPADLGAYYPADYYAYQGSVSPGWRQHLRRLRNRGLLKRQAVGQLLNWLQPFEALQAVAQLPWHRQLRILDVGCGQGLLVNALRELGFKHVLGIDPFLKSQHRAAPQILAQPLSEVQGTWDLIMFHHSLEHLPDPRQALQQACDLLAPRGFLLIRVPTPDSLAWHKYRENWVQWDPPRHLFLFSRQYLQQLATHYPLRLCALYDDSTAFQFWGSERYLQGQALQGFRPDLWQRLQRRWQALKAQQLNRQGQGDQLVCLFQKR